jgi:hypothetical protein
MIFLQMILTRPRRRVREVNHAITDPCARRLTKTYCPTPDCQKASSNSLNSRKNGKKVGIFSVLIGWKKDKFHRQLSTSRSPNGKKVSNSDTRGNALPQLAKVR